MVFSGAHSDRVPRHPRRWVAGVVVVLLLTTVDAFGQRRPRERRTSPDDVASLDLPRLQPAIDAAIDRGVAFLLRRQLRDGSWGAFVDEYGCGQTALCLFTLLESGLPTSHPAVRRAFAFLDDARPAKTYTVSCLLLAYAERHDDVYEERMEGLLALLLGWQRGSFGYPGTPAGLGPGGRSLGGDLSNAQFAALGLRAARLADLEVPPTAWEELLQATLAYQENPRTVGVSTVDGRSATGSREVAGFRYRVPRSASAPRGSNPFGGFRPRGESEPTGSMTAAGIAVLEICREGLGNRLRGKRSLAIDRAQSRALAWLEENFSVRANPGRGGWRNYYLYGVERIGALLALDRIGEHDWYLEGARELVFDQTRSGSWSSGNTEASSCFALLFLQRATAPTSGARRRPTALHTSNGQVRLRATGTNPLSMWIDGFEGEAPRVVDVTYLVDDEPIVTLEGNPRRSWEGEQFAHQHTFTRTGPHRVGVRVRIAFGEAPDPDVARGALTTDGFSLTIENVLADWMLPCARARSRNLLPGTRVAATASSSAEGASPRAAVDGEQGSAWIATRTDLQPRLTLSWSEPLRANTIRLAGADARLADRGRLDTLVRAEVTIDERHRFDVLFDRDPLAPAILRLDRARTIRRLDIRLLERIPRSGERAAVGLAEVQLSHER